MIGFFSLFHAILAWIQKINKDKRCSFITASYFMLAFCLSFISMTGYSIHYSPTYKDTDFLVADFVQHSWYGWLSIAIYVVGWYFACFFLCAVFEEKKIYVWPWNIYFVLFNILHFGLCAWRIYLLCVENSKNPTFLILECLQIFVGVKCSKLGYESVQYFKTLERRKCVIKKEFR